jgi:hypothetical protein
MDRTSLSIALTLASASLLFSAAFAFLYARMMKSYRPKEDGALPKKEIAFLFVGSFPPFALPIAAIVLIHPADLAEGQKTPFIVLLILSLAIGAGLGALLSGLLIEKQFERKGVSIVGKQFAYFINPSVLFCTGILLSLLAFCLSLILLVS